MGLDAQVIAIGPYSESVASALEYGQRHGAVAPGTEVVTNIFIAATSEASHRLAAAFGVDAWDLGKHALREDAADLEALVRFSDEENVARFELLRSHGFRFYYLPNG